MVPVVNQNKELKTTASSGKVRSAEDLDLDEASKP